jgi:hypothetical protein
MAVRYPHNPEARFLLAIGNFSSFTVKNFPSHDSPFDRSS